MLMSEAGDLDFTDPTRQEEDGSPNDLLEPGFEISKVGAWWKILTDGSETRR